MGYSSTTRALLNATSGYRTKYDYDTAGNRTARSIDGVAELYVGESSSAYKLDKTTTTSGGGGKLRDYTTDSALV